MRAAPERLTDLATLDEKHDSLRRRLMLWLGGASLVLVAGLAWGAYTWMERSIRDQVVARLTDAGHRSAALVDRTIADRERVVRLLGASPVLRDAALAAGARARAEGLAALSIDALEARYAASRSLDVDPRAREFLRQLVESSDAAELLLTDAQGLNAVTTSRPSDFVQRDEDWWQAAQGVEATAAEASFDESAGMVSIAIAGAVRAPGATRTDGVLKVVFGMQELDLELAKAAERSSVEVALVDEKGGVIAASTRGERLRPIPGLSLTGSESLTTIRSYVTADDLRAWAAIVPVAGGRWRVVATLPEHVALAPLAQARLAIIVGAGALVLVMIAALAVVGRMVARRVTEPTLVLAEAAERVAAGDLSVRITSTETDEIGRLTKATGEMIDDLRRLVSTIRDSANETSAMSTQITAGAEEMSAAASEMAHTSAELSEQSADMARTIQEAVDSVHELRQLADGASAEAKSAVDRTAHMRTLARDNRARLDDSARALEQLATEAQSTAAASDALAEASEQIRAFVSLVRKIARQSKLLALNASMEAARAGVQGEGFAVVASEIRKLAANSNDAAERTESLVNGVLGRVDESRRSSRRTLDTVSGVRKTTREAIESFAQVERAMAESEQWVESLERAARDTSQTVGDITRRLETLARGTESFAAAMEQVAAGSQQQSASTEEIAAAAAALAESSRRLSALVATFKLDGGERASGAVALPDGAGYRPAAVPAAAGA